jgi:hypothetical protein
VRETIGAAIARSRSLANDERPTSDQEVVRELIKKLDMPPALQARLKERHRLK